MLGRVPAYATESTQPTSLLSNLRDCLGHGREISVVAGKNRGGKEVRLVSDSLPSEPDKRFSRIRLSG